MRGFNLFGPACLKISLKRVAKLNAAKLVAAVMLRIAPAFDHLLTNPGKSSVTAFILLRRDGSFNEIVVEILQIVGFSKVLRTGEWASCQVAWPRICRRLRATYPSRTGVTWIPNAKASYRSTIPTVGVSVIRLTDG